MYLMAQSRPEAVPPHRSLTTLPMSFDGWIGQRQADLTPEVLAVLGVDDYLTRAYVRDRWPLDLYIGYHTSQRQGDTIHSPLNCLPGAGWQPMVVGRAVIPVKGAPGAPDSVTPVEVNRVIIQKGVDRQLVLYWYQSHRRVVAGEYRAKIYTVFDAVRYNRTDAAMVRIVSPVSQGDTDGKLAEQRATMFAQTLFPMLGPFLPS